MASSRDSVGNIKHMLGNLTIKSPIVEQEPPRISKIHIFEQDQRIQVEGNVSVIREFFESMTRRDFLTHYSEYKNIDKNGKQEDYALLRFGIWNFKTLINGHPIIQIFLNFLIRNKTNIDDRTLYFLNYWNHEIQMMESNQSYRSTMNSTIRELTSPTTLNTVLNLCKNQFPPIPALFKFLENSDAMKGKNGICQPVTPTNPEIKHFLLDNRIPIKPPERKVTITDERGNVLDYRLFSEFKIPNVNRFDHDGANVHSRRRRV